MAIFKKAEKKAYTTISTYHLLDTDTASQTKAKTKGLLTQMLSLPDDWNYTETGLAAINEKDGRTAIRSCLQELQKQGYLDRAQSRTAGNKLGKAVYTIYEKPKHLMKNVNVEEISEKSKVFRVIKTSGYSFLSNYHLRDKTLSLSAKCILSQILVLPETYNITIETLTSLNKDTHNSISKYVKELISSGYILCKGRERKKDGTFGEMVYEVFEKPHFEDLEFAKNVENSDKKPTTKIPTTENSPTTKNPTTKNPTTENPTTENPTAETEHNKLLSNKILFNKILDNQSIYPSDKSYSENKDRLTEKKDQLDDYKKYKDIIKQNIKYNELCKYNDIKLIDNIVEIMSETVVFCNDKIRILDTDFPAEIVKSRFCKIGKSEILSVIHKFKSKTKETKIRNARNYLISMLYNSDSSDRAAEIADLSYHVYNEMPVSFNSESEKNKLLNSILNDGDE